MKKLHLDPKKYHFTEKYTQVLLEDVRKDFKAFGETLEDVRRDVGALKDDVADLKERVAAVELMVKDIPPIKKDMETMKQDIETMMRDIEDVKKKLEDGHISAQEFRELKSRVSALELLLGKRAASGA